MEQSGCVAALKAPSSDSPVVRRSDILAVETVVNLMQCEDWAQQLAGLKEAVADAIDESLQSTSRCASGRCPLRVLTWTFSGCGSRWLFLRLRVFSVYILT